MIKQRFIIDDCGTLIDVVTRKHYDYVSDVVDVLNDLDSENTHLKYSLGAYMVDLNNYKGKCSALEQENEQLKEINRNLQDFRNFITEKNVFNEKERKNLQLQMLRLYNYFENYFEDTMSHNAFNEMWDNVKEDEKWEKR